MGWRNENILVRKKPPLAVIYRDPKSEKVSTLIQGSHTRDVMRSVHGELATAGDACAVTAGGIKLHRRNARVNPSMIDKGSSNAKEGAGTTGNSSTIPWIAAYSPGTIPETMKDGVRPRRGAVRRCGQYHI